MSGERRRVQIRDSPLGQTKRATKADSLGRETRPFVSANLSVQAHRDVALTPSRQMLKESACGMFQSELISTVSSGFQSSEFNHPDMRNPRPYHEPIILADANHDDDSQMRVARRESAITAIQQTQLE